MTAREPITVDDAILESVLEKYEQALMDAVVDVRTAGVATVGGPDGIEIVIDYRMPSDR